MLTRVKNLFTIIAAYMVLSYMVIVSLEAINLANNIISSPEPKAHGELIGYPWSGVSRPSSPSIVRPQFQTSSLLKPLGQSKPSFIWSLLGKGERKFIKMVQVT